jgi:anti-sigma regulatory factor (Ser/Thr protein kinase)
LIGEVGYTDLVRIHLPNSAHLHNLDGFLRKCSPDDPTKLEFSMHDRWVSVHPVVVAMTACAGQLVSENGGTTTGEINDVGSLPYLIRMKLFEHLNLAPGREIEEHEESGRVIPLIQIKTAEELRNAIVNLVPLLHAPAEQANSIKYVFSELARNVLEHARSPVGAFICAQYYRESSRVSIGIADAGVGVRQSMARSHRVRTAQQAITLALQPGISGVRRRPGGNESNAGAGLFFTKSIAALSRNFFVIYSEDCMFKLLRGSRNKSVALHGNPEDDNHKFVTGLPPWPGTVVGINLSIAPGRAFADFLAAIGRAYSGEARAKKKEYYKRIQFT